MSPPASPRQGKSGPNFQLALTADIEFAHLKSTSDARSAVIVPTTSTNDDVVMLRTKTKLRLERAVMWLMLVFVIMLGLVAAGKLNMQLSERPLRRLAHTDSVTVTAVAEAEVKATGPAATEEDATEVEAVEATEATETGTVAALDRSLMTTTSQHSQIMVMTKTAADKKSAGKEVADAKRVGQKQPKESLPKVVIPHLTEFLYDIALSSGDRPLFGATFGSCLVGLMASGAMLHAGALHLLLSDAKLLNFSLVHNLAHMGTNVRVSLYDMAGASNSMRARNTFYQLLRVPDLMPGSSLGQTRRVAAGSAVALGGSDLPTVLLEDDVWLVDDFPSKMHVVASHAARRSGGNPFVIKLYLHSGKYGRPDDIRARHATSCNVTVTNFPTSHQDRGGDSNAVFKGAAEGGPGAVLVTAFPRGNGMGNTNKGSNDSNDSTLIGYKAKPRTYKWGAQGLFLSDGLTRRRLADCYLRYTTTSFEKQRRFKDWPLKTCLAEIKVSMFDSGRSLVQHIGAASSLFGDASKNSRYHRACSFPFLEKLPSEDMPRDWF